MRCSAFADATQKQSHSDKMHHRSFARGFDVMQGIAYTPQHHSTAAPQHRSTAAPQHEGWKDTVHEAWAQAAETQKPASGAGLCRLDCTAGLEDR